jgi:hypothetical protein
MYPDASTPRQAYSPGMYSMYPHCRPFSPTSVFACNHFLSCVFSQRLFRRRPSCSGFLIPQQGKVSTLAGSRSISSGTYAIDDHSRGHKNRNLQALPDVGKLEPESVHNVLSEHMIHVHPDFGPGLPGAVYIDCVAVGVKEPAECHSRSIPASWSSPAQAGPWGTSARPQNPDTTEEIASFGRR